MFWLYISFLQSSLLVLVAGNFAKVFHPKNDKIHLLLAAVIALVPFLLVQWSVAEPYHVYITKGYHGLALVIILGLLGWKFYNEKK